MANSMLSWVGWWFLPTVVSYIQTFLYSLLIRAGDPKPQPGTPRYIKHRKIIHASVIITYLLYSIYEADWQLQRSPNFYNALSVPPDASERQIQSRFRRLTLQFHPDKLGDFASATHRDLANNYYVYLTQARDTLVDPAKRFAYDRFGPDMLKWKHCKTVGDFVVRGIQQNLQLYIGSAFALALMHVLGYLAFGTFWRYLTFLAMLAFEAHTITRPDFPAILTKLLNPIVATTNIRPQYIPFQLLAILHRISFASFIAVSQLAPMFQSRPQNAAAGDAALHEQLNRLAMVTKATDVDASRLIALETMPFAGEKEEKDLKGKMKDWLVQNSIRSDPVVRDALGKAFQRRRQGAPAGARGTT
ncbi:hypothetical protein K490DRAFT_34335 [Saccharata proteae CBS 121410]|uniref:J domain-containing protein n=1 Tax=Saccharata proteae CBS 121410 TaxID=1314787 RepID=A0A9P4I369_9PEZI|nr:hypothetical protein K490DRAFT_34335 [Saccharata proteae CBS 121410]